MFHQLFNCPDTVARHRSAPLLDERIRFLQHCREYGSPRGTLRRVAHELLVVVDQLNLQSEGVVTTEAIEAAAHRWAYRQPSHHKCRDSKKIKRHFTSAAMRWLRFLSRLQDHPAFWYHDIIEEFASYMEREKGLSPMTIHGECGHVQRFLARHCGSLERLGKLSIRQIDEAIALKRRQDGCNRASVQFYAASLRAFFRYAETRGWLSAGFGDSDHSATCLSTRVDSGWTALGSRPTVV